MAEDTSSVPFQCNSIPDVNYTIFTFRSRRKIIDEIRQKYSNMTTEDCKGYFHGGAEIDYKKVTIWSQGIDSLWFNAIIARVKELADVNSVPIVSGGKGHAI